MRKLATAAAVSLALASGGAFGLGLGDIEMRSALNQPMNAEIPLTSVKSGELDGMIVKLADEAAFNRAGIDRSEVLKELTFSVDSSSGRPVIRIASRRPVVEPFLNFLLEVDWPQGRMVREYTVLLDPPVFMTQGPTARDEGAETRAVIDAESALIAPAPITRDAPTAAVDGLDVELLDAENKVADAGNSSGDGEVISLDELDADSAALPVNPPTDGEVVSLTDLAAPNTAAPRGSVTDVQLSDDLFEVEIIGEGIEVEDGVTAAESVAGVAGEGAGEVVSLDDLDAPVESVTPADAPAAVARNAAEQSADTMPEEVRVASGDTLFEIARDTADTGVTTQQMMLALLEANRSSFINDNINLVKAGSLLRVPRGAEAQALTQAQALAEIGRQTTLWQEYRDNLRNSTASTQIAASETPADTGDSDAAGAETADADATEDGLTPEARAILESARNEVLSRDELSIVADSDKTASNASATTDNTDEAAESDTAARLSSINRQLQLAREELSASRVQGGDLDEQVAELTSTGENLDALVSLRQTEVARLEAQLAGARDNADAASDEVAADIDEAEAAVADTASDAATVADDAIESAVDAAGEAADAATDAAGEIVTDAGNAVSAAGEEPGPVELLGDSDADGEAATDEAAAATDASADAATPAAPEAWYQTLMNDPTRLMIAGAGAVGLLGVLGALLMRRRRKDDAADEQAGFRDGDVEIIDEVEAADLQAEVDAQPESSGAGASVTGVAAAAAAGTAAAADAASKPFGDDAEELDASHADPVLASDVRTELDAAIEDDDDKDDTISEVDVYLAYGLHGQAEELLTKAIERKPDNMEYAEKLLQTYHVQGNAEGYRRAAEDFQTRFGGDTNPAWAGIAEKGSELRPGDALFAAGAASVAAVGTGQLDSPAMSDDDFAASGSNEVSSSVSRDFTTAEESIDEEGLMDQSIDPAFAFDESDLEATGDFSQIADELAAERNESIDFPGFGDQAAAEPAERDALSELPAEEAALEDALTLDELDLNASSGANDSDELMLDFDELDATSLDEAGLLDEAREGLELPDVGASANSADEMDTMMDLAKAYIDMGDKDSASNALDEIVKGGSPAQISEAETLLRNIS